MRPVGHPRGPHSQFPKGSAQDRKSTRLNSSHPSISYAVFCLKKKKIDYFAMHLALPRMASYLGSTTTDLQWLISIYMLALSAFMATACRTGDMFGLRRNLLLW